MVMRPTDPADCEVRSTCDLLLGMLYLQVGCTFHFTGPSRHLAMQARRKSVRAERFV